MNLRVRSRFAAVTLALLVFGVTAALFPHLSPAGTSLQLVQAGVTPVAAPTALPQQLGRHPVYVLDVLGGRLISELIGIDADARKSISTLSLRYNPEIQFSPDGDNLYVLDAYFSRVTRGEMKDVLSVYDANSLAVRTDEVPVPDRLRYKIFPISDSWFQASPGGNYLLVGKYGKPDVHQLRLTVLDAVTFRQLVEYPFPICDGGRLHFLNDERYLCLMGRDLYSIQVLTQERISLVQVPAGPTALTILSPKRNHWFRLDRDGRVTVVELGSSPARIISENAQLELPRDHSFLSSDQIAMTQDGARLYIGFAPTSGELFGSGQADVIRTYDTRTWTLLGELTPTFPARYLALSNDGTQLYTTNSEKRTFAIYDAIGLHELGAMPDLGMSPSQILIPPQ